MSLSEKINSVIGNTYDYSSANCWDLVMLLNANAPKIDEVHESIFSTAKKFKDYENENRDKCRMVLLPNDGDIVILGNGGLYTHAGIYYADGVVHASKSGVIWQSLYTIKKLFSKQRAYRCEP